MASLAEAPAAAHPSGAPTERPAVLKVNDLHVELATGEGVVHAVNGVSFEVHKGEALAIVGESGSGKSMSMLAVMGLVPKPPARQVSGQILFEGRDLLTLDKDELRKLRGSRIGMIFQDPRASLDPVFTIGDQISEGIRAHEHVSRSAARARSIELLKTVNIPSPERIIEEYPHRLSGGMCQRVMLAIAIAGNPTLLIADEPTTALDITTQSQLVELIRKLQRELDLAVIWITHDLGVVAGLADRVLVMYAGRVVESGPVQALFDQATHPYTKALLACVPSPDGSGSGRLTTIAGDPLDARLVTTGCPFAPRCEYRLDRCLTDEPMLEPIDPAAVPGASHQRACWAPVATVIKPSPVNGAIHHAADGAASKDAKTGPLLDVRDLEVLFPVRRGVIRQRLAGYVHAVDGISLSIDTGETLALVGESGSGKTTTGRAIAGLVRPTGGTVLFDGRSLTTMTGEETSAIRQQIQMVFQNPAGSLNPRMTVGNIVGDPLEVHSIGTPDERRRRVREVLELVGLDAGAINRYPHQFSGGQQQRIGIARALVIDPRLVICDEPVSALDLSIRAQIINLLADIQARLDVAYLLISHDLGVVRHVADRVAVMYLGRIVETGRAEDVYAAPGHPYTKALLSNVRRPDPARERRRRITILSGEIPSPTAPPSGCSFHTRCPLRTALDNPPECVSERPTLRVLPNGASVACHFAEAQLPSSAPVVEGPRLAVAVS